jgi:hypothetical protein
MALIQYSKVSAGSWPPDSNMWQHRQKGKGPDRMPQSLRHYGVQYALSSQERCLERALQDIGRLAHPTVRNRDGMGVGWPFRKYASDM